MGSNQLHGLGAQPGPLADALARARVACDAAYALMDAGPGGGGDYMTSRGDVGMAAAHALYALLAVLGHQPCARPALTAADFGILGQALADAIAYREPSWPCSDCGLHRDGRCPDHAADQARTGAYLALADSLGIEMDR